METNILPGLLFTSAYFAVNTLYQYMTRDVNGHDDDFLHIDEEDTSESDPEETSPLIKETHSDDTSQVDAQESSLLVEEMDSDDASQADFQQSSPLVEEMDSDDASQSDSSQADAQESSLLVEEMDSDDASQADFQQSSPLVEEMDSDDASQVDSQEADVHTFAKALEILHDDASEMDPQEAEALAMAIKKLYDDSSDTDSEGRLSTIIEEEEDVASQADSQGDGLMDDVASQAYSHETSHAIDETHLERHQLLYNGKPLFRTVDTSIPKQTSHVIEETQRESFFSSVVKPLFQMIGTGLGYNNNTSETSDAPENPPDTSQSISSRPVLFGYYGKDPRYMLPCQPPLGFPRLISSSSSSSLKEDTNQEPATQQYAAHQLKEIRQPPVIHASFRRYNADMFPSSSSMSIGNITDDTNQDQNATIGALLQGNTNQDPVARIDALLQENKGPRQPRITIKSSLKRSDSMMLTNNTRYSSRSICPITGVISRHARQRHMISSAKPSRHDDDSTPLQEIESNTEALSSTEEAPKPPPSPELMPPPPPTTRHLRYNKNYNQDVKWEDILTRDQIRSFTKHKRKRQQDNIIEVKRRRINNWLHNVDP